MSLVENINKRKKAGTSRSKANSTISDKAYADMQSGWKKKGAYVGKSKKKFKPHKMYDKNGKSYMANTMEDHLRMKKKGYSHMGAYMGKKKKKSFPDLNKDGKITQADILMGRGVKKKGAYMNALKKKRAGYYMGKKKY
tara:strand:+ start:125 stop:541 length:417 start_codon:yes stop_codon:yes gene_type:complete